LLEADENVDPALAAPPPPFWCSMHGWVICPLHEYGPVASPPEDASLPSSTIYTVGLGARRESPTSVFELGGASNAAASEADEITPRAPSPTPVVVAPTRLPSPTPATPPPSPREEARRRLAAFGLPLSSPASASPSGSRERRSGTWRPAALDPPNSRTDGVAPGARLRGDSSGRR
jgi:hypothetical protein